MGSLEFPDFEFPEGTEVLGVAILHREPDGKTISLQLLKADGRRPEAELVALMATLLGQYES